MDFNGDALRHAALLQVLNRGSAEVLESSGSGLFLWDEISRAHMLYAEDRAEGEAWLERHAGRGYELLLLYDAALERFARARFGYADGLACRQAVYLGAAPPALTLDLEIRPAAGADFDFIARHYRLLPEEGLDEVFRRGLMYIGLWEGRPVGFVGQHLEGSAGLLEVLPEYRRRGFGAELERFMIGCMLAEGMIPYCQVKLGNAASLRLQRRLGLELSPDTAYWLF